MNRLTKLFAVLAFSLVCHAGLSQTTLNTTNMTVGVVGQNDNIMFIKYSGGKYYWNRCNAWDFFNYGTNSPSGQAIWAAINTNTESIWSVYSTLTANLSSQQLQISAITTSAVTQSNALQAKITANDAKITATTNGLSARLATYYPSNNPAGFQTAAQVQATADAAAAAAASGAISTNGAASFASVTVTNAFFKVVNYGNVIGTTFTVDLSAGSYQFLTWTNIGPFYLDVTNQQPGQSVTVVVNNNTGAQRSFYMPNGIANFGNNQLSPHNNGGVIATFISLTSNRADIQANATGR